MSNPPKKTVNQPEEATAGSPPSIGVAKMLPDGTIILWLRAEGPKGEIGDATFTYKKSDPKYADILKHLGGLKAGEEKPVPPWA